MFGNFTSDDVDPHLRGLDPSSLEEVWLRLLDKLPTGAYTCDAGGLITHYNSHAERLWGRAPRLRDPAERFCGSHRLYGTDGRFIAHEECWMAQALRLERHYDGMEIVIEQPSGDRHTVLANISPIHDPDGTLLGAVNVLVDISDRKNAEDALRAADRAKDEFLATVSHEIRTPMNAIVGYIDLLDVEVAGPLTAAQRVHLGRLREASGYLLSLINEVLDLSKAGARRMIVRLEPGRVHDAVEMALAVVQPLAAATGIRLVDRSEPGAELGYFGDGDRLRQMLINLLSNAIKFSEPGSTVELSCANVDRPDVTLDPGVTDAPLIAIRVRDSGIGLEPDELELIFEPFVQVQGPRAHARVGTGLGLTIARRLARLMGGDLTVESERGSGSTFTIWLVATDPPAASRGARGKD